MAGTFAVWEGDCRQELERYPDNFFHSVVTDPPYHLTPASRNGTVQRRPAPAATERGFMGKRWDGGDVAFQSDTWARVLRVTRPGGFLLAFGGARRFHRLACAIEDAGWELVDGLVWLYGNGFPKGLDVAKAIDKRRDDRSDVVRVTALVARARDAGGITNADIDRRFGTRGMAGHWTSLKSQPAVPDLETWQTLKEFLRGYPIGSELAAELDDADDLVAAINARKGTFGEAWHSREVTGDMQQWDERRAYQMTSADGKRRDRPHSLEAQAWEGWNTALKPGWEPIVMARKPTPRTVVETIRQYGTGALNIDACRIDQNDGAPGRWPANVVLDSAAAEMLDDQSGESRGGAAVNDHPSASTARTYGKFNRRASSGGYYDEGGASRFFYTAKASSEERDAGCEDLLWKLEADGHPVPVTLEEWQALEPDARAVGNAHPTVKPLDLMRWCVRLVTMPGGHVLDPFAGSGSTLAAGVVEGFDVHGIELDGSAALIAERRAAHWQAGGVRVIASPISDQITLFG